MYNVKKNLVIIIAIAFILISFFSSLSLIPVLTVFAFDQARDAYEAYAIWSDFNLKIMGPSSDIPGINHGVLWYYFLAVIYAIGSGLPERAVMVMTISLYAMLPLVWYFTWKMTQNKLVTAISVALYATAPLFSMLTIWLSNPTLALFVTPPLLYFIWRYLQNQTTLMALLIGFFFGLLIQTDFGFVVLLFVLPVYYIVFRCKFMWKHILFLGGGLFAGLLTYFISYIKFHINVPFILLNFLQHSSGSDFSAGATAIRVLDELVRLFTFTYLPLPALVTFFVLAVGIYIYRKQIFAGQDNLSKFLAIWLSGFFILFIFNRGVLHSFFYTPFLFPLAIYFTLVLTKVIKNSQVFLAVFVVLCTLQLLHVNSWARQSYSPLSVQKGVTTNHERAIIDYIYQSAGKKQFVINTITNPLWINTTWSYWFTMYGKPTYGYLPLYWGKDQTGYLGSLPMQTDIASEKLRYLIIEPTEGIQNYWVVKSIYEEDLISDIVEEKSWGNFRVQKRLLNLNKTNVATPAALLKNQNYE